MSATADEYSRVLQHRLERMLAGIGLAYPLLALDKFKTLEKIMIDQLAVEFLRKLLTHEHELKQLEPPSQAVRTTAILSGMSARDCTALWDAYNHTAPGIYSEGMDIDQIASDLVHRIKTQTVTRAGFSDLLEFIPAYLEGVTYA